MNGKRLHHGSECMQADRLILHGGAFVSFLYIEIGGQNDTSRPDIESTIESTVSQPVDGVCQNTAHGPQSAAMLYGCSESRQSRFKTHAAIRQLRAGAGP